MSTSIRTEPLVRFLVLGMQRSGTTVTHSILRGHPAVAMTHEEIQIEPFFTSGLSVFTSGKQSYLERRRDYHRLFDLLAAVDRRPDTVAMGFKVAINDSVAAIEVANCVREYLPGVKIILVHREDLVAQLGSLRRALATGEWHLWEGSKASARLNVDIPVAEFEAYANDAITAVAHLRGLARTHDVLEFQYERDIAPGVDSARLFQFLGLPAVPVTWSTVEKVAPPPQDYITDYPRLLEVLHSLGAPADDQLAAAATQRERERATKETATFLGYRAWERMKQGRVDSACADFLLAFEKRRETPIDLSLQGYLCGLLSIAADIGERPSIVEALAALREESNRVPRFIVCHSEVLLEHGRFDAVRQTVLDLLSRPGLSAHDRASAFDLLFHALTGLCDLPLIEHDVESLVAAYADTADFEVFRARLARWCGDLADGCSILEALLQRTPEFAAAQTMLAAWQAELAAS